MYLFHKHIQGQLFLRDKAHKYLFQHLGSIQDCKFQLQNIKKHKETHCNFLQILVLHRQNKPWDPLEIL